MLKIFAKIFAKSFSICIFTSCNKKLYIKNLAIMNTLEIVRENNKKLIGKSENGLVATIVKIFYSKRKFNFCVNFCTKEQIKAGFYIACDGVSKVEVIESL